MLRWIFNTIVLVSEIVSTTPFLILIRGTSFFNWIMEAYTLGTRGAVRCFGVGHRPKP